MLLVVFSLLIIEGWLEIDELHGIHKDKLDQIKKFVTLSKSVAAEIKQKQ